MRMRALVWVDYRGLDCRLVASAVRFWVSLLTSLAVVVRSALVAAGSPNRLAGTLTMAKFWQHSAACLLSTSLQRALLMSLLSCGQGRLEETTLSLKPRTRSSALFGPSGSACRCVYIAMCLPHRSHANCCADFGRRVAG